MFGLEWHPSEVERMTVGEILDWHGRAIDYRKRTDKDKS
ncbi:MAG: GpE family phage tail protein [Pseudomonadota bacterium]